MGYGPVPWDPSPLDFKVQEAYQPAGQRILNETLDRFRDGECYMGADALEVVWVARAALHEEGIFNAQVITQVNHFSLCTPTSSNGPLDWWLTNCSERASGSNSTITCTGCCGGEWNGRRSCQESA